ncbi:MAG: hypothetical protein LBL07_04645 [Tannerella sp.]|jgi:hypothetical protein|nr:hypothetical protein [Tannerella sp.]
MSNKDFIPGKGAKFNDWQKALMAYLALHKADWNIDPDDFEALLTLQAVFAAKYAVAENPATRTGPAVTAKREAMAAYKKGLRQFIREFLTNNHLVTDEDRRAMQLPIHDTKPSKIDPPKTSPVAKIDFAHQQHTIRVQDITGTLWGENASRFEVWRKIGGDPPVSDSEFEFAGASTSTTKILQYSLEQVGQTVHYRYRWLNERNQPGPWSETIDSVVIP